MKKTRRPLPHPHLLFLLDYDGTLTDFKKNPEHSRIPGTTRTFLRDLRKKYPVILVSGRNVAGLTRVSGLAGFPMVGTHGFEGKNLPRGLNLAPSHLQARFKEEAGLLWKNLQPLILKFPGIHIERKPFSSTLHYRGTRLSAGQIDRLHLDYKSILEKTVTRRLWALQKGKKMIEAMPLGFTKGKAVRKILEGFPGFLPIYAGDDLTDISVFKALGKNGLKVAVGRRIPHRFYDLRFENPREFLGWLRNFLGF